MEASSGHFRRTCGTCRTTPQSTGAASAEGPHADAAHELRTPIAALMGHTEVALARERSADALRDTLTSNLEEPQRLAAFVNDMLFLSRVRSILSRRRRPLLRAGPTAPRLGLSIVAAIARMHAGRTVADSRGGRTRVGFTLAA